jgi:ABC-2 type transport system ATP-binding protein
MIKLENISKSFGNKVVVDNLNLEIPSGEIFAFLGPNGAGKTTTIKMMVGLLRPNSGRISIGNFDLETQYLAAKKIIAYVPDQPYLYDKLSGREFLQFIGQMYGLSSREIENEIARLGEIFELTSYIDELTEDYSHGMKQRVVFASALLHSPQILIVDEPMVGLDPKSIRIVKDILKKEAKKNCTIFMSTHSLDTAEETATRIGMISMGKVIALGTLEELRSKVNREARLEEIFMQLMYEKDQSLL